VAGLCWLQRATWAGQAADAARAADQVPVGHLTLEIGCQLKGFRAGKKLTGACVWHLQGYLHLADSCRVRGAVVSRKRTRKDYTFLHQFNEKPSIIWGCPGFCCCVYLAVTSSVTRSFQTTVKQHSDNKCKENMYKHAFLMLNLAKAHEANVG